MPLVETLSGFFYARIMDQLTQKQQCFVREYLIDLNGKQAGIRAGFSPKTAASQASRLLKNVNVSRAIEEAIAERAEKTKVTAEWVVDNLKEVVERSLVHKPVMEFDSEEQRMIPTGEYQFDSAGANRALELLGKHLGMFNAKPEHPGAGGVTLVVTLKINDDTANRISEAEALPETITGDLSHKSIRVN